MPSWGKGWEVGVRKAIYQHEKTERLAAEILETECGKRHETGTHSLCPRCQQAREAKSEGTS